MSVNIKPLEDRIVVKPLDAEQTTASGLVIPDTAKEKPQEGEVVAVGPGRIDDNGNRVPVDVAVGDRTVRNTGYSASEVSAIASATGMACTGVAIRSAEQIAEQTAAFAACRGAMSLQAGVDWRCAA